MSPPDLQFPLLLVTAEGPIMAERAVARDLGPTYREKVKEVRYLPGRGLVIEFRSEGARSDCQRKWARDAFEELGSTELYAIEGGSSMPEAVARALVRSKRLTPTDEFLHESEDEEPGANVKAFFRYSLPMLLECDYYVEDAVEQVKLSMGKEFDTFISRCQWMQGRGLMLDFKINAARRRWETFWSQRPVGFEKKAWAIKRFYRYPLVVESWKIHGAFATLTPMEFKAKIKSVLGNDWKTAITGNSHFFHNAEDNRARGLILDFKTEERREKWRAILKKRNIGLPVTVRDFKWYTDDLPSNIAAKQEQLAQPGAVEKMETPRIFVGGLNKTTTAVDLVIYFSKFGSVKKAMVMANSKTGKSRGFGYVTFNDRETTDKVLGSYHNLMGSELAVQKALSVRDLAIRGSAPSALQLNASPEPSSLLRIASLNSAVTTEDLKRHFSHFGPVVSVKIVEADEENNEEAAAADGKSVAYVRFASVNSAERALHQVRHEIKLDGDRVTSLSISKAFAQPDAKQSKTLSVMEIEGDAVQEAIAQAQARDSTATADKDLATTFLGDMESLVEPLEPAGDLAVTDTKAQLEEEEQVAEPIPGDLGIDPFNVRENKQLLRRMRLAEIKHGRLAMLAAAAWPLQELFDPALANLFRVAPLVTEGGRNPSLINGGLQQVSPLFWAMILGATAVLELLYGERGLKGEIRIENADLIARGEAGRAVYSEVAPGDLGFDPLGLFPDDIQQRRRARNGEINNGRLAMLALTTFVVAEYFTGESIVDLTPMFFKPIGS